MSFRQATLDDEHQLYLWRTISEADGLEGGWYKGALTKPEEHHEWLIDRLDRITILIWEENGRSRGAVRIDSNGEIAICADNVDIGVRMLFAVKEKAEEYGGRLKATIDEADARAWATFEEAGFTRYPVRFYAYKC